MKKIYYIGYYSDLVAKHNRKAAPAADTKMDYIIESMKKIGYEVEVFSFCENDDRKKFFEKKTGYEVDVRGTKVIFFTNYTSKYRVLRVIGRIVAWIRIKKFLCERCMHDECKIVVYHSLGLLNVIRLLHSKHKKFILETEEIYADVIGSKRIRKKELKAITSADGYIFPTRLLNAEVNALNKPAIYIHGTYQVETDRKCKRRIQNLQDENADVVHCVYAGTFDPRKGGAAAAAAAAEFLPSNYHIHILGFGSDNEVKKMKDLIERIANRSKATVTYDGLLSGEEYIRFIQSCDIGLSTQDPTAAFNSTSFPSKILSYLANGLRVVSIRIPAIEQSAVGSELFYYDVQTPENIAKAIISVDMHEEYDSRQLIKQLSDKFEIEINELLKGV